MESSYLVGAEDATEEEKVRVHGEGECLERWKAAQHREQARGSSRGGRSGSSSSKKGQQRSSSKGSSGAKRRLA